MDPVTHDNALAPPQDGIPLPDPEFPSAHSSYLDHALSAFDEALALIDKDEQPAFYGIIMHDIAQTYEVAERFDVAVELYRESVGFKRRADNLADISTTLVALAQCLMSSARLDEAFSTLGEANEALGLAAPGLETGDLLFRLHEIGILYERMGNKGIPSAYDEAITAYERALDLVDREADPKSYASVVRSIGDVHGATGRLHDSVSAYSEAVSLLRTADDHTVLAGALIDLGRMSRRLAEADGQKFLNDDADTRLAVRRHGDNDIPGDVEKPSPRAE